MSKQHYLALQDEKAQIEEEAAEEGEEDEQESEKEIARRKKKEALASTDVERLKLLVNAKHRVRLGISLNLPSAPSA